MLGSSIQHNSTARGLASRESEFEALLTDPGAATSISRVSASEFAADDATALAACAEPFLVAGTLTGWRGSERWHSVETLLDAYGDLTFSLAHDVTVTLREYAVYARSTGADCPYYLVERRFEDGRAALLDDFAPPPPFSDDLFRYVPGSRSARYWFCGGPRSGTFLHADPLCTAAWNAVTCGAKRWCFLPPETDLASLGLDVFRDGARQIASAWFVDELPRLQCLAAEGRVRMVEVVQRAGELVYIPAGWYHAVLNLGPLTVAVSQNFVAPAALPRIWPTLLAREATFAAVLTDMLEHCRPDVAAALPARESAGCGKASRGPSHGASAVHSQPCGCQRPNWHAGVESKEEGISLGVWWRPVEGGGGVEGSAAAAEGGGAEGGGGESARSVLFVSAAWLDGLLSRKPTAAQSVELGTSAPLYAVHAHLASLARLVAARGAALCLSLPPPAAAAEGRAGGGGVGGVAEEAATAGAGEARRALAQHGLRLEAAVLPGRELDWAREHGASEYGVLGDDGRAAKLHAAIEFASTSRVRAAVDFASAAGCSLRAAVPCAAGDVLLAVPLDKCLTSASLGAAMSRRLPVADGFGRLLAATLCLMREAPDDPRLSYYAAACPPHHFCEHMAWWREGGEAARVAANSVSYRRVARMRREVVEEGTAFAEAGYNFTPPPPWDSLIPQGGDMFLWVKLLLQTRAVETDQGHVLPPCVCLANHRSVGESAKVCVADGEVRLVATVALGVDDEVSINYDPEADYLDLYERYGFWDESAVVHTAEVVVPPAELEALLREAEAADEGGAEGAPPPSAIRRELVAAQAEAGSDPTLQAWWLPDHLAEAAPLLAALRATVLTPSESAQYARDLAAGEAGREAAARRLRSAAVQNEDAARARMARLVRAHLAGFENGAAGGASPHDAAGSFEPEAAVAAARRLVGFERALLEEALVALGC